MKEELLSYIDERIAWHKGEQARLKAEYRQDEAAHVQIAINVYNIFRTTYQAMKYDLNETVKRFSGIISSWDESRKRACEHGDDEKRLIEEIKLARAMELLRRSKEMEAHS
ncbi:MAG: hypothetical protein E7318_00480 [Clostridiales bacterium]|nr:hypothetical protein [Clostridiales bacterium]